MQKFWPFSYYFLYFAALSALMPNMVLYYQQRDLTGGQIGLLTGLAPLITIFGAPLLTGLADATHRHKLIMSLGIAGVVVVVLGISRGSGFLYILPLVILYSFVASPINSLADSATLSMLGDEKSLYGRVRLGGTIGWGIMAWIAGCIIQKNGILWAFYIYAIGMTLTLLVSQKLSFKKVSERTSIRKGLGILLTNRRFVLFLCMVFIAGVGMAGINNYFYPYMKEAGAPSSLMGFALTISTLSEAPVLLFANVFLRWLKPRGLLILGMAAVGLRMILYALFPIPIIVLAIQLLHGFTFPVIWVAGVSYTQENAPEGMVATALGVFGSVMMGFGSGAGGLLGGLLIDRWNTTTMFAVMGVLVLVIMLIFLVVERKMPDQGHSDPA